MLTVAGDDRSRGSGVRSEHEIRQSRRCGAGHGSLPAGGSRGSGRPRTAAAASTSTAEHRRRVDLANDPDHAVRQYAPQAGS